MGIVQKMISELRGLSLSSIQAGKATCKTDINTHKNGIIKHITPLLFCYVDSGNFSM